MVGNLCRFFKGGFSFEYANNLTIPELIEINNSAQKISQIEEREMRLKSGN